MTWMGVYAHPYILPYRVRFSSRCMRLYRFASACRRSVLRDHEGDGDAIQVCLFDGAEIPAIEGRRVWRQQEEFISLEDAASLPNGEVCAGRSAGPRG